MESNFIYLKTVQSIAFKILMEALKEILTDINLEFDETGITVKSIDNSRTVLIYLKLEADKFEKYYCESPRVIGINTLNLFKLIKTMNNNDTLTLYIAKDNISQLGIFVENGEKNSYTRYNLNLIDVDEQDINMPDLVFNSIITMPSNDFQKILRDSHNICDVIEIVSFNNQLTFNLSGEWCSQQTVIGENPAVGMTYIQSSNADEIIQGRYLLKYLILFTKATNLSASVELYLKNDYPLILKYSIANLGNIKLALAPITDIS
jgi:proliferating cell nuclear antigen